MGVRIEEKSRVVMLEGEITPAVASDVCYALLKLEGEEPWSPITLLIDSPGGDRYARSCQCGNNMRRSGMLHGCSDSCKRIEGQKSSPEA